MSNVLQGILKVLLDLLRLLGLLQTLHVLMDFVHHLFQHTHYNLREGGGGYVRWGRVCVMVCVEEGMCDGVCGGGYV